MRRPVTAIRTTLLLAAAAALALPANIWGQNTLESPYAMTESCISGDPVSLGTGFAGMASVSSYAWASFCNPAILPFGNESGSAAVSWMRYSPSESKSDIFSGAFSLKLTPRIGVSAGVSRRAWESYETVTSSGKSYDSFTPEYLQANIGAGAAVTDYLSVGVNVRMMHMSAESDESTTAFAGDAFVMLRTSVVDVSAGVSNIGGDVEDSQGDKFHLPASLSAGASRELGLGLVTLRGSVDGDCYIHGGYAARGGIECDILGQYFVRCGGGWADDKAPVTSTFAGGIGVKLWGIALDAAYVTSPSSVSGTFCIGASYHF